MAILDWLNQNIGILTLIFTFAVAIATIAYAILTWKLAAETQKMREAQTEPFISIHIEPNKEHFNFIEMVIQNIGLGPAYNLKFSIKPDFEYFKDKKLSDLYIFKEGVNYLAPKQTIRFFLTSLLEEYQQKLQNPFKIEVKYNNSIGNTDIQVYSIDFQLWEGMHYLEDSSFREIKKSLDNIEVAIKNAKK